MAHVAFQTRTKKYNIFWIYLRFIGQNSKFTKQFALAIGVIWSGIPFEWHNRCPKMATKGWNEEDGGGKDEEIVANSNLMKSSCDNNFVRRRFYCVWIAHFMGQWAAHWEYNAFNVIEKLWRRTRDSFCRIPVRFLASMCLLCSAAARVQSAELHAIDGCVCIGCQMAGERHNAETFDYHIFGNFNGIFTTNIGFYLKSQSTMNWTTNFFPSIPSSVRFLSLI